MARNSLSSFISRSRSFFPQRPWERLEPHESSDASSQHEYEVRPRNE